MSEQSTSQQRSPLQSDRGTTTIQSSVVAKVAGIAAQEVEVSAGEAAPRSP